MNIPELLRPLRSDISCYMKVLTPAASKKSLAPYSTTFWKTLAPVITFSSNLQVRKIFSRKYYFNFDASNSQRSLRHQQHPPFVFNIYSPCPLQTVSKDIYLISAMSHDYSTSFLGMLRQTEAVPTDFVLEAVNGVQFPCYKILLSVRSKPLAAMMNSWKEGKESKMCMDEDEETVKVQRNECVESSCTTSPLLLGLHRLPLL